MYELAYGLRVKYGFAKPPRTRAVANKAQISFLIDSFIYKLTTHERNEEKSVLLGLFLEVCQTCVQRAPTYGLWFSGGISEFCDAISLAYDEVVHWKHNLFQVPSGSSGKALVLEISRLYRAYADCSSLESVALKVCSVLVALALVGPARAKIMLLI